jgi:uncharacterized membrane protein
MRAVVGVACAVVIGVVLVVAGVSKLARPRQWRAEAVGMGVSARVVGVTPWVELAVGALLVAQVQRGAAAWAAAVLLAAFTALIVVRLRQGLHPPCACFGALSSRPVGAGHLARNALLIALAVAAAVL